MNPLVISSLILTAGVYCGLSATAFYRKRTTASLFFAAMMGLAAIWAATYAGEINATQLLTKIRFLQIRLLFICFIPFTWLGLVLTLTGRLDTFKKPFIILMLIVPTITGLLSITTLMHNYFRYDFAIEMNHGLSLLTYKRSGLDMFHEASNHLVSLLGFFILIGADWHSTNGIRHKQITLLGISFIIPLSFNLLFVFKLIPTFGINPTPFVLLPGSFLQAWVIFHSHILNIIPTAWPLVFDHIGVGIIVLDKASTITAINPAAQALIGTSEHQALGYGIRSLPSPWNDTLKTSTTLENPVHLPKNGGAHWLSVKRISIGESESKRGTLILLQDVTADILNQQKAELMREVEGQKKQLRLQKRILRDIHDGLGGLASNLSLMSVLAEKEEDPKCKNNWLSKIEQSATEINEEIRDLMSALERTSVNWGALIASIRHTASILFNHDLTTVTFKIGELPESETIGFAEGMSLTRMVRECMNNIVKHAQASQVVIDLAIASGQIRITITDNGCGFNPDTVKRGRGLKNLVKRATELGGHFETTTGSGTRQRLTLPLPLRIETELET